MSAAARLLFTAQRRPCVTQVCVKGLKRYYARGVSNLDDDLQTDRMPSRLRKRLEKQGVNPEEFMQELTVPSQARPSDVGSVANTGSLTPPTSSSSQFPHTEEELKQMLQEMNSSPQDESQEEQTQSKQFPSDMRKYNDWRRDQSRKAFRPKVDPANTTLILFPGQGSQFVGMGKNVTDYRDARELYEEASEVLKYDLLNLCLSGPMSSLSSTVHCQPAVLVSSLAALQKLQEQDPQAIETCIGTAGLSVGEYAALVFAGALDFADAVRLVQIRAEAMQRASEEVSSGMMTVFLGREAKLKTAMLAAREYCSQRCSIEKPVCTIANYLYPECKVIAGHTEGLEFIEKNAKAFGIRRTKRLAVSGAFHTSLMASAVSELKQAISRVSLKKPEIPVYSNVTASIYRHPKNIAELLPKQVTTPVKWEQLMHVMYSRRQGENFPKTFEMGPGNQLGVMLKQTNLKAYQDYTNIEV